MHADSERMDPAIETAARSDSASRGPSGRRGRAGGHRAIWLLAGAVWLVALFGLAWLGSTPPVTGFDARVGWWWLALGFYAAELLVVHLQFRRDAHTFSMSEIPMTVGLLLADPLALIVGQLVGSALALVLNRKQRAVKLVYNLGHLGIQTVAAVWVVRMITNGSVGFDGRSMLAIILSQVAALFIGHVAVLLAILATGGTESMAESARVFVISTIGTVSAALLGLGLTISIVSARQWWWIGVVPSVLVFVAYRGYVAQSEDKGRIQALFDAATTLHRTPEIDRAVEAAAQRVLELVKAEAAAIILLSTEDNATSYVTVVDHQGRIESMIPTDTSGDSAGWVLGTQDLAHLILEGGELRALERVTRHPSVRQAVTDTLSVGGEFVGMVAGINRIGDVSSFDDADVRVLSTLTSQLSTTLENSRLTDTLSELRSLKEQLEALIESKDRLVASVSHELRTPLTGVIGLAAVIRETAGDKFDTDTLDMLDLIVSQGSELANIVEDLLAHARAEAGTLTLKPQRFDVTKEMALVSASHQLEPAASDAPQSVWAFADPLRVRQIVRNLITNALAVRRPRGEPRSRYKRRLRHSVGRR